MSATDTTCEVARAEAPAGTVEFTVTNTGTKVNEFYVYAEGDRIVGEVENVTPGPQPHLPRRARRARHLRDRLQAGDGRRRHPGSAFTVTGASAAPKSDDENLAAATAEYQRYVGSQADAFLDRTTEFVALVKAGKVEQAKALYPTARSYWERIEPVAESFGDLDPKIDGRAEVVDDGMEFTGYHRLEKDLWEDGLQPDSSEDRRPPPRRRHRPRRQGQGRRAQPAPARQRLQGPPRRDRDRQDHR